MTIIAWDGKILAADSRVTRGTTLVNDNYNKLHDITIPGIGKAVIGVCGALDVLGPWLTHLKANGFANPFETNFEDSEVMHMRALCITRKGVCFEFSTEGGWHEVTYASALGSGDFIAQHFLSTGHDALKAVQEACKTELSCGGKIITYDFTTHTFTEYSA